MEKQIGIDFKETLNPKLSYHLTAILSYDNCEYAISSSKGNLLSVGSFPISDSGSVEEGLRKVGLLDLKISKFYLSSNLAPVNFIKSKDFKSTKLKAYFKDIYPSDKLLACSLNAAKLKGQRMYVAHGIPKYILARFEKLFPKLKLSHLSEAMCNYANKKKHNGTLVFVGKDYLAISCHKKGQSYFYNKFDCFGESDFYYYLSLVFEVLELNEAKETILVAGAIKPNSRLAKLLGSKFKKLKWVTGFYRYATKAPNNGAYYAPHFMIKL